MRVRPAADATGDFYCDSVLSGRVPVQVVAATNYKIITIGGSYQSTPHLHFHLGSRAPLDPGPAQAGEMAA